jgi:phage gpG-like protein
MIKKYGKPINQQVQDLKKVLHEMPRLVGTEAVNFAQRNFDRQGFIDEKLVRWKPLDAKSLSKRHAKKGRKALIITGALKRSIRIAHIGKDYVRVGTDMPQARLHNEGGTINQQVTIRSHKRKIKQAFGRKLKKQTEFLVKSHKRSMNLKVPARQFLGHSRFFNRRIAMILTHKINQALGNK